MHDSRALPAWFTVILSTRDRGLFAERTRGWRPSECLWRRYCPRCHGEDVTSEKLALDTPPTRCAWWAEEVLLKHLDQDQNVLF